MQKYNLPNDSSDEIKKNVKDLVGDVKVTQSKGKEILEVSDKQANILNSLDAERKNKVLGESKQMLMD